MDSSIIVAVIAAVGALLVALVQRGRRENKGDHAAVMRSINMMHNDVRDVRQDVRDVRKDVHNHLAWHAKDDDDAGTSGRDTQAAL